MPNTIADLAALGFTVGIAHGSVAVEQDALTAARADADPTTILAATNTVTSETVEQINAEGKLPTSPAERLELTQRIAAAALDLLTTAATERLEFHERALALAQEMPDVWVVDQVVAGGILVARSYIWAKEDGSGWDDDHQATIDTLADPAMFTERAWQGEHPDAMALAAAVGRAGVAITRPSPGDDVFEAEGRTLAAADLETFLAEVVARPAPLSTSEKVAAALANVPELSDASKQTLRDALADG